MTHYHEVYVFLIWDSSREDHGEPPDLVCIYGTKESAEAHIRRAQEAADCYGEEGQDPEEIAEATAHLSVEERMVIG